MLIKDDENALVMQTHESQKGWNEFVHRKRRIDTKMAFTHRQKNEQYKQSSKWINWKMKYNEGSVLSVSLFHKRRAQTTRKWAEIAYTRWKIPLAHAYATI